MIETIQRRLNPRYYAGPSSVLTRVNFKSNVKSRIPRAPALEAWVKRVEKVAHTFNLFPCEGTITAVVISNRRPGYLTEGSLFVFDDRTLEVGGRRIVELFDVLRDSPANVTNLRTYFTIIVKPVKVNLKSEGKIVPFDELDTEPREKPTRVTKVAVPCPMLN